MPREPNRTSTDPTPDEIVSFRTAIGEQLTRLRHNASLYYEAIKNIRNILGRFDFAFKNKRRISALARYKDESTGARKKQSLAFQKYYNVEANRKKILEKIRDRKEKQL